MTSPRNSVSNNIPVRVSRNAQTTPTQDAPPSRQENLLARGQELNTRTSSGRLSPSIDRDRDHALTTLRNRAESTRSQHSVAADSTHTATGVGTGTTLKPITRADKAAALAEVGLAKNYRNLNIKLRHYQTLQATQAQKEACAAMLNKWQPNPLSPDTDGAEMIKSARELVQRLRASPEDKTTFKRDVLGLTAEQDTAKTQASKTGGSWIPTSSSFVNAALLAGLPVAGLYIAKESNPYVQFAASAALLFGQPFYQAPIQTMMVSAIDLFRTKAAPRTNQVSNLKATETLPQLQQELQALTNEAQAQAEDLGRFVNELRIKHPTILTTPNVTAEQFSALLASKDFAAEDRGRLQQIDSEMTERSALTMEKLIRVNVQELLNDRQDETVKNQRPWRDARVLLSQLSSALLPLANHPSIAGVDEEGKPNQIISSGAIVGTSAALAIAALVGQHIAAGKDEVVAEDFELMINMLAGDFLNETGKAQRAAGQPVTAEGIDGSKILSARGFPEPSVTSRVVHFATAQRNKLALEVTNPALLEPDLEAGTSAKVRKKEAQLALEDEAIEIINNPGRSIEELEDARFKDTYTKKVLDDAMRGTLFDASLRHGVREGVAKGAFRWGGDYGPQTGQRAGQAFMAANIAGIKVPVLGGGAGALSVTTGTKMVMHAIINAATHPTADEIKKGVVGAAAAHPAIAATVNTAAAIGATFIQDSSAKNQGTAVVRKNIERAKKNPDDKSWLAQVKDSISGPGFHQAQRQAATDARPLGQTAIEANWRGDTPSALREAVRASQPTNPQVTVDAPESSERPVNAYTDPSGQQRDADEIRRG